MVIQQMIDNKLVQGLQPVHLEVINESHMHSVPENSETHFKVVAVSESFEGKRPVQRHQQVYQLLQEEMSHGVHALALHTYTPKEWSEQVSVTDSPQCLGGSKAE
ncbi:transcriptional regulator BolA [Aurantivibrio plasticivorans]